MSLRRPKRSLGRTFRDLCQVQPSQTTFLSLPPGLLLSIVGLLPAVDLICLMLCSHELFRLWHPQRRQHSLRTYADKLLLLNRLERDSPQFFACDVCKVLHRLDGLETFGLSRLSHGRTYAPTCVQEDWFSPSWNPTIPLVLFTSGHELSFLQVKLAMRRLYYGDPFGITTSSMSLTQVRPLTYNAHGYEGVWLFSRDFEICSDHTGLYMRTQDIFREHNPEDFYSPFGGPTSWNHFNSQALSHLKLCAHKPPFPIWKFYQDFIEYSHCTICSTDSKLELCDAGASWKKTIVLTKWVNLGRGITPYDPLWENQIYCCSYKAEKINKLTFGKGPRLCFETLTRRSYDVLKEANLALLRDESYKWAMCKQSSSNDEPLWFIQHERPSLFQRDSSGIILLPPP